MTGIGKRSTGAPFNKAIRWVTINWKYVAWQVKRLQMRIAKAVREGRFRKAKALQWLLTHSYFAKLLAVKRVTSNKGKKTPGIDGVVWTINREKIKPNMAMIRHKSSRVTLQRLAFEKCLSRVR